MPVSCLTDCLPIQLVYDLEALRYLLMELAAFQACPYHRAKAIFQDRALETIFWQCQPHSNGSFASRR